MSSLRRGHANLLCIVPILVYVLLKRALEKTLESPLHCKEIKPVNTKENQSWIFIGRTDTKAETPYFGHLMQITDSLEKTLILGKIEGRSRRGWIRMRWSDGIIDSMDMVWVDSGSWWWTGRPGMLRFMGSQSRTRLSDWTKLISIYVDQELYLLFT